MEQDQKEKVQKQDMGWENALMKIKKCQKEEAHAEKDLEKAKEIDGKTKNKILVF